MPANDEMLFNWSNALRQSVSGEQYQATRVASSLKDRGYTAEEALDVMVGDDYDLQLAHIGVQNAYASAVVADKPVRQAMVVPTSYDDIESIVTDTLRTAGPKEFVKKIALSSEPLVRVSRRSLESLTRLATQAMTDARSLARLHFELKPWLEDAMLTSVLAAEKHGRTVEASTSAQVDLESGTCQCTRFARGNFADFGLACDHMVAVADSTSPHQRLMRAIREK